MNLIQQRVQIEVDHRLKVAWGSFHKHRRALVNQNVSLKLRLRLFYAVVTLVAPFGIAILPLTNALMKQITLCNARYFDQSFDAFVMKTKIGDVQYSA